MSRVFAIKYDLATGDFTGQNETTAEQLMNQASPGEGVVPSVREVISTQWTWNPETERTEASTTLDFTGVTEALLGAIDAGAELAVAEAPEFADLIAGVREAARVEVLDAAPNLRDMATAGTVDWSGLIDQARG